MGIGQFRKIHDLCATMPLQMHILVKRDSEKSNEKDHRLYRVLDRIWYDDRIFMPNVFVSVLFIFGLLLLGYFMFCC